MTVQKKLFLAELRGGNYTHPGEEEAIDIVMQKFSKNNTRQILDVGCGLGGTAKYIQDQGFGTINAIDTQIDCINYAKSQYSNITFHHSDVLQVSNLFHQNQFNLIYLFSSFLEFESQQRSLTELAKVAQVNTQLVIFEYINYEDENKPFCYANGIKFTPIHKVGFNEMLSNANWQLDEIIDLSDKFKLWYDKLVDKMLVERTSLITNFGHEIFEIQYNNFKGLRDLFKTNQLGGCVVFAHKMP